MTRKNLLSLAMALILSTSTVKALAQPSIPLNLLAQNQSTLIPESTALVVTIPHTIELDLGQNQDYSTTLPLAQPILDSAGNILIPQYSPIVVRLIPFEGNIRIVAESMVIRGRVVPIQAISPTIYGNTITVASGREKAKENIAVGGTIGKSLTALLGGDFETEYQVSNGGVAIGIIAGLTSPKKIRVVTIPQGSVHVLNLQTLLNLVPTTNSHQATVEPTRNDNLVEDTSEGNLQKGYLF